MSSHKEAQPPSGSVLFFGACSFAISKDLFTGGRQVVYAYDWNGNRVARTTPAGVDSGAYDAQDRLLRYRQNGYGYSPSGYLKYKVSGSDSTSFSYDAYGNLVSVRLADGTWVQYLIDAANRRVGKMVNGATTQRLLYSGDLKPVAELDSTGSVVTRYVFATHENVPEYMARGGVVYRFVLDHLGSVRLVVNSQTGDIAQRLDYDEFGKVLFDSKPGFIPFGFAGGLYDCATNLVRFGARDYDATVGRWTCKDPIIFGGESANLYAYASNDPNNLIDANGRFLGFLSGFWESYGTTVSAAAAGGVASVASGYLSDPSGYSFQKGAFDLCTGIISGGAGGMGSKVFGAATNFVVGSVTRLAQQAVSGEKLNAWDAMLSGGISAAFGSISELVVPGMYGGMLANYAKDAQKAMLRQSTSLYTGIGILTESYLRALGKMAAETTQ